MLPPFPPPPKAPCTSLSPGSSSEPCATRRITRGPLFLSDLRSASPSLPRALTPFPNPRSEFDERGQGSGLWPLRPRIQGSVCRPQGGLPGLEHRRISGRHRVPALCPRPAKRCEGGGAAVPEALPQGTRHLCRGAGRAPGTHPQSHRDSAVILSHRRFIASPSLHPPLAFLMHHASPCLPCQTILPCG